MLKKSSLKAIPLAVAVSAALMLGGVAQGQTNSGGMAPSGNASPMDGSSMGGSSMGNSSMGKSSSGDSSMDSAPTKKSMNKPDDVHKPMKKMKSKSHKSGTSYNNSDISNNHGSDSMPPNATK